MIDTDYHKFDMEYLAQQYEFMCELYKHPDSFGKERIEKLRIAFNSFDRDGNGVLDREEVADLLAMNFREGGVSKRPTEAEVNEFFASIDDDDNYEINFEEFKCFMLKNMVDRMIKPLRAYLLAEGFNLEDLN